jgi:FlaA1/EpsC-like NDP-sugar epimerase
MTDRVSRVATGREGSLYAADVTRAAGAIRPGVEGKRILVIGGAGSIGSATIHALLPWGPASIDVIDHDENGLAELVRDARSRGLVNAATALRCFPLDYGSMLAARLLDSLEAHDVVLHFAALKHVRSEKDATSVLQMIDTNVLKQRRLIGWLADRGPLARYFAVSTDKAADPVSFMGASKRLMEHLLFTPGVARLGNAARTSARFANVAFSAGSLLAGWRARIEKGQPIAVPRDTRRYFVSMSEAAEICLLAAFALRDAHLAVPRMTEDKDLRELTTVAADFLRTEGREPIWCDDESSARSSMAEAAHGTKWPVLRTPRDTAGEKAAEIFAGRGESPGEAGFSALLAIPQGGADPTRLPAVLDQIEAWVGEPSLRVSRDDIAKAIQVVVPEFAHSAATRSLDERM